MIHLKLGDLPILWLTLAEKATLTNPNFLLVATHRTTLKKVKIILKAAEDLSPSTSRFNAFKINVAESFADSAVGQYGYQVFEQVSDSNTDESQTGAMVEEGMMNLLAENETVAFISRDSNNQFIVPQ